MRRFEFVDGKSSKFWSIALNGTDVDLAWGRIGTDGQTKTKSFGDAGAAQKEYDKLIKQKTGKGYVEVGAEDEAQATAAKATEVAPAPEPGAEPEPPVASEAAAAASPEPPIASAHADERVVWGDEPVSYIRARGDQDASYEVDYAAAWQGVRDVYEPKRLSGIASGRSKLSKASKVHADAVLAVLDNEDVDDARHGAAFVLQATYWGYGNSAKLVRWLIAKKGLAFATEAALRAFSLGRNGGNDNYYVFEASEAHQFMRQWEVDRLDTDNGINLQDAFLELRAADAAASDSDHAAAADAVRSLWAGLTPTARVLAAVAFPSEDFWRKVEVPERIWSEDYYTRFAVWLLTAPDEPAGTVAFAKAVPASYVDEGHARAVVGRLGLGAAAVFSALLSRGVATWAPALEYLESREAFALYARLGHEALPYLHVLMRRPRLAAEALAPIAADSRSAYSGAARAFLAMVGAEHKSVLLGVAAERSGTTAADVLLEIAADPASVAAPEELPAFLTNPPWLQKRKAAKPTVVAVEAKTFGPVIHMTDGDRQAWSEFRRTSRGGGNDADIAKFVLERMRGDRVYWYGYLRDLTEIDDPAVARSVWEQLDPAHWHFDSWTTPTYFRRMLARWGTDAVDFLALVAERDRVSLCNVAAHVEDTRIAPVIAEAFARLKTAREDAAAWLTKYPRTAAIALVPPALGKTKKPREYAEKALRWIATTDEDTVIAVAREYGDDAAKAIESMLASDPMDNVPSKPPKLPAWWSVRAFPRLLVAGSGAALDDKAMDAVVMSLALSKPDEVYPGVEAIRDLCTPQSLERFAVALFRTWLLFGASSKEYWALYTMGWFGGDEAARILAPLIRKWPGESAAKRATTGLDVLATIGTDVALMHVYAISQKVKYASIKKRAGELVDQLAEELGLTRDELGDRLVPDFDLDDDGSTTIDYGTRTFKVRFDEALKPVIFDESGKRLKSLPKPGKSDGEVAAEEKKRYTALGKDVRAVAKQQVDRLERAMCSRRRWKPQDFVQFFVQHPLVLNLAQRLVWGVYEGDRLVATFRVDETGELVDAADEPFELPGGVVGIPHALDFADEKAEWEALFGDYQLLQPFPQLARETRELSESAAKGLLGRTVSAPTLVFGLEQRGWRRGEAIDGGAFYYHEKEFGDLVAMVEYSGAVGMGFIEEDEPLTVEKLEFSRNGEAVALPDIDPIIASETALDLEQVTSR